MKLTPFESAIERVAERIIRKHKKDLEAYAQLLYSRAIGQAVEFLDKKTSPARKANKTRKEIANLRLTLKTISNQIQAHAELGDDVPLGVAQNWQGVIEDALRGDEKGGEA